MANNKVVHYGKGVDDYVIIKSLIDELIFVELMKLYKACDTFEDLESVLTEEGKKTIRKII